MLRPGSRSALEELFAEHESAADQTVLVAAYAPVTQISVLIEGYVVRVIGQDGDRTIVSLLVPGDLIDLPALGLGHLDHDLVALGPVTLARAPLDRLRDLALSNGDIGQAVWIASQLDGTIQRQWTLKLGRLKASRRVARLLSELWHRLDMVGLAGPDGYHIPMTQQDLADICGTTPIHMNRALGELRRLGLADLRRGHVTAPDRDALEHYGAFRANYLKARPDAAVGVIRFGENHILM